ncbi:MAG: putative cystathionine [Planctomycetota bacterium]|nr:MAG: putative cystathionine [Planctomycetota bacterium]
MLTVGDICTRSPRVTTPEASLAQAAKVMWEGDCGMLPVIDAERKVIGVISDRDVALALAVRGAKAHEAKVREAMGTRVVSCRAEEPIGAALSRLAKFQVRRLPVVSAGGVIEGILSIADAISSSGRFMGEKGQDLTGDAIVRVLQAIGESPDAKKTLQIPGKR